MHCGAASCGTTISWSISTARPSSTRHDARRRPTDRRVGAPTTSRTQLVQFGCFSCYSTELYRSNWMKKLRSAVRNLAPMRAASGLGTVCHAVRGGACEKGSVGGSTRADGLVCVFVDQRSCVFGNYCTPSISGSRWWMPSDRNAETIMVASS
jgi:hypothetical protein